MGINRDRFWIQDVFDSEVIHFDDAGDWQVQQKLSEKERMAIGWTFDETDKDYEWMPSEAHAVYECVAIAGPYAGQEAVLKVRIQIPNEWPPSDEVNEAEGAKFSETDRLHYSTESEITYLEKLTKDACPYTPRMLAWKQTVQEKPMLGGWHEIFLPGAYIVFILMDKLPGEDLLKMFDRYMHEEREEIRVGFRKALNAVHEIGVMPLDSKMDNLIWDKETKTCYLIDFEDATHREEEDPLPEWDDRVFIDWGLSEPVDYAAVYAAAATRILA